MFCIKIIGNLLNVEVKLKADNVQQPCVLPPLAAILQWFSAQSSVPCNSLPLILFLQFSKYSDIRWDHGQFTWWQWRKSFLWSDTVPRSQLVRVLLYTAHTPVQLHIKTSKHILIALIWCHHHIVPSVDTWACWYKFSKQTHSWLTSHYDKPDTTGTPLHQFHINTGKYLTDNTSYIECKSPSGVGILLVIGVSMITTNLACQTTLEISLTVTSF